MKLQCNVCIESPVVNLPMWPEHEDDNVLCPSCNKQLAWVTEDHKGLLQWKPIDTAYNTEWGGCPVTVIEG